MPHDRHLMAQMMAKPFPGIMSVSSSAKAFTKQYNGDLAKTADPQSFANVFFYIPDELAIFFFCDFSTLKNSLKFTSRFYSENTRLFVREIKLKKKEKMIFLKKNNECGASLYSSVVW